MFPRDADARSNFNRDVGWYHSRSATMSSANEALAQPDRATNIDAVAAALPPFQRGDTGTLSGKTLGSPSLSSPPPLPQQVTSPEDVVPAKPRKTRTWAPARNTNLGSLPGYHGLEPRASECCDSILEGLLKRVGLGRHGADPDRLEGFLRANHEAVLGDVYHTRAERPASDICGVCSLSVLRRGEDDGLLLAPADDDPAGTISDFFESRRIEILNADAATVRVYSYAASSPVHKTLFPAYRLFASNAWPTPEYYSKVLHTYFLLLCGHVDVATKDSIIKSSVATERDPPTTEVHEVMDFSVIQFHASLPFAKEPLLEKIEMWSHQNEDGSVGITLMHRTDRILHVFNHALTMLIQSYQGKAKRDGMSDLAPAQMSRFVVLAIHDLINTETEQFICKLNRRCREMAVSCRQDSSRSHYLYIVILEDNARASLHHLRISHSRLQAFDASNTTDLLISEQSRISDDIRYLEASLEEAITYTIQCKDEIRMFADLKQAERSGITSLLVAVYVPLAFVSSYLGMNTTGINGGPTPTSTFWAAAIPVTVATILLPLSAAVIARLTIAATFSASIFTLHKWPRVIDLAVVGLIAGVIVAHIINLRLTMDGYFVHFFDPISRHEPAIVGSPLGLLQALKVVEHVVQRNVRAYKWFAMFAVVTAVCFICAGLSAIDPTPATLVVPICFLIFCMAVRPLLF